jgi:hypothetical protein
MKLDPDSERFFQGALLILGALCFALLLTITVLGYQLVSP